MVWQGGLLGRHRLLPHEHPGVQLFCANWKLHNTMAFTAYPTDPKTSQREEPCSAVSHIFHCIDDLERVISSQSITSVHLSGPSNLAHQLGFVRT